MDEGSKGSITIGSNLEVIDGTDAKTINDSATSHDECNGDFNEPDF
jgi:hypothetical protein